jgi:hypothetical protein
MLNAGPGSQPMQRGNRDEGRVRMLPRIASSNLIVPNGPFEGLFFWGTKWRNGEMNIADVTIAELNIDLSVKRRAIAAGVVNGQRLMVGSVSKPVLSGAGEDA